MQRLEVSCAVRRLYRSLGVKGLTNRPCQSRITTDGHSGRQSASYAFCPDVELTLVLVAACLFITNYFYFVTTYHLPVVLNGVSLYSVF